VDKEAGPGEDDDGATTTTNGADGDDAFAWNEGTSGGFGSDGAGGDSGDGDDDGDDGGGGDDGECLRAFFLQIAVLSNHQNGRDTHVRQMKIFGPRTDPTALMGRGISFATPEFGQFATVR
jgi:anaphase-promoting complex subunit 10